MIFNRATEVAIQALVFLAQQPAGKLTPTHEIAAAADVPEPYLAKVLQRLSAAGLVRTFRGSGKGVELGKAAEEIPTSAVVVAAQEILDSERCVLGLSVCSEQNPCALHDEWLPHRAAIQQLLDRTTIANLARFQRPELSVPVESPPGRSGSGTMPENPSAGGSSV